MKNTHESAPVNLDADREKFLDNNDRGFEVPVDPEKAEQDARDIAEAAFLAIATQVESGHNID